MDNGFSSRASNILGPAELLRPVAVSDDADLPGGLTRGLFVGGAGTLSVIDRHGNQVELISTAAQYHPLRVRRVRATGTTATQVVALY